MWEEKLHIKENLMNSWFTGEFYSSQFEDCNPGDSLLGNSEDLSTC